MRRNINEQINRMYDLIYGKKTLNQKSIKESKPDVADLVEPNVAKFFEKVCESE
jgi:hypothetical protein